MSERIQKRLANAGVGSRREIERLIDDEKIRVNGEVAQLGDRIESDDQVSLEGRTLRLDEPTRRRVILYHKPVGEVCTRDDPEERPTVFESLPHLRNGRWISIGRLDLDTSGLLLFTNDGELAHRFMHPSSEIEREYAVRILGEVELDHLQQLTRGVELEDGAAHFDRITDAGGSEGGSNHWYHVVLREGRRREVRRLWEALGFTVSRLMRIRFGPITLPPRLFQGRWLELSEPEVERLLKSAGITLESQPSTPERRGTRLSLKRDGEERGGEKSRSRDPNRAPRSGAGNDRQREEGDYSAKRGGDARPSRNDRPRNDRRPGRDQEPTRGQRGPKRDADRPERGNRAERGDGRERPFSEGRSDRPRQRDGQRDGQRGDRQFGNAREAQHADGNRKREWNRESSPQGGNRSGGRGASNRGEPGQRYAQPRAEERGWSDWSPSRYIKEEGGNPSPFTHKKGSEEQPQREGRPGKGKEARGGGGNSWGDRNKRDERRPERGATPQGNGSDRRTGRSTRQNRGNESARRATDVRPADGNRADGGRSSSKRISGDPDERRRDRSTSERDGNRADGSRARDGNRSERGQQQRRGAASGERKRSEWTTKAPQERRGDSTKRGRSASSSRPRPPFKKRKPVASSSSKEQEQS